MSFSQTLNNIGILVSNALAPTDIFLQFWGLINNLLILVHGYCEWLAIKLAFSRDHLKAMG